MFKKIAGILALILGIVALFVQLLQGTAIIFIGLESLGLRLLLWNILRLWIKRKGDSHRPDEEL